jgi:NADH dehydrogenase (ubiquinone) 1 alpha/beta subcomplex 1
MAGSHEQPESGLAPFASARIPFTATKMSFARLAFSNATRSRLAFVAVSRAHPTIRFPTYVPRAMFSAAAGLDKAQIAKRVLGVLEGFEKVDQAKVCL